MSTPNEEPSRDEAPAPRKGGKGRVATAAIAVLALCGAGAYALHASHARGAAAAATEEGRPALYLPLDPPFVVNFQNRQAMSYLQVGVTLMARDPAAIQAAKDADPVIRNALVMLFSSQDYAELSSTQGKQKLREQALESVRKVMQASPGRPGIDALYFTSFVMQ
ncbi:flagellar basal body-associated FliL family protein [Fulvimonas sp. R45]|uniref:flagellar basal body-associated FliL family protein n=1 Tax=Fulvimonas sp. R45 TaxID=3045937 RepID=UPI00265EED15|nr:flagellar basal body-associated FliL family protein [Fulvimonas sp. R45]MDO1528359.1 flagellar basal body-associated FliL family protein [Fulvimonas sp. R45]